MKTLSEFINEAKQYFYKSDNLIIYGGDHELERMYDRNITQEIIEKTLNKVDNKLLDLIKSNELNINDEIVIRNKNTKPYLNMPIKYEKIENILMTS